MSPLPVKHQTYFSHLLAVPFFFQSFHSQPGLTLFDQSGPEYDCTSNIFVSSYYTHLYFIDTYAMMLVKVSRAPTVLAIKKKAS
jgi:hypothetical protein